MAGSVRAHAAVVEGAKASAPTSHARQVDEDASLLQHLPVGAPQGDPLDAEGQADSTPTARKVQAMVQPAAS